MKKNGVFMMSALSVALMFAGCKKENPEPNDGGGSGTTPIQLSGEQSTPLTMSNHISSTVLPDYIVSGTYTIKAGVEIQPGTTIMMKPDAMIFVEGSGYLKANGTSQSLIRFKGESASPGYWGGIAFLSNNVNNQLHYVSVEDGGGNTSWDAIVYGYENGRMSLSNASVKNSGSHGILVYSEEFNLSECSFVDVTSCALDAISIKANDMKAFDETVTASNNGFNRIKIDGGSVDLAQNWSKTAIPFYFDNNVTVNAPISIAPGANFIFGSNRNLTINNAGSLQAIGTANDLITFSGHQATEGSWAGIRFVNSASSNNHFEYCDISYGGSESGWEANIYLYDGAHFRMGNSTVRNSLHYGLINYQDANTFTDDGNNTFSGNLQGDIGN